jgi:hypothetical protein
MREGQDERKHADGCQGSGRRGLPDVGGEKAGVCHGKLFVIEHGKKKTVFNCLDLSGINQRRYKSK